MSGYRRILLIADRIGSHTPALDRAAALARRCGAAVHLALFDHSTSIAMAGVFSDSGMREARDAYLQGRRAWLESEAQTMRAAGVEATVEVEWTTHPLDEILLHIDEMQPDLVIKDTQYSSFLTRLLLTPLDLALARRSSAPLHLVGETARAVPRRVVAALDVGDAVLQDAAAPARGQHDAIIAAALDFAIQTGAELHLASAFDLDVNALAVDPVALVAWSPERPQLLRQLHEDAFVAIADRYGVPPERRHFVDGEPAPAIDALLLRLAADCVVLGARPHSLGERLAYGSTLEKMLAYASTDVLLLRPGDTSA